jgi:hypothetical protein
MRTFALAILAAILLPGASDSLQTKTEEREFAPGGSLKISLRAGDLKIVKAEDPQHIHLRYKLDPRSGDIDKDVHIRFDVHGSVAEIEIKGPSRHGVEAVVEIPSPTDLQVRMTAGDLRVERVEGNKDLELHVGDLQVEPCSQADYGPIDASTYIGDVQSPFGQTKGWLGQSLKTWGSGRYRLHAHVGIGDIGINSK